jgi:hypothetical protein
MRMLARMQIIDAKKRQRHLGFSINEQTAE